MIAAVASLALSLAAGHSAIAEHERAYWKGSGAHYTIVNCRRRDARQVSCRVELAVNVGTLSWTDIATRSRDGRVRVTEWEGRLRIGNARQ